MRTPWTSPVRHPLRERPFAVAEVRAAKLARHLPKSLRRWGRPVLAAGALIPVLLRRPRERRSLAGARRAFYVGLGGTYLTAFTSLGNQVLGLYGSSGILPVQELLDRAREVYPDERLRLFPSLLWLDSSDEALVRLCRAGQVCSVAMMLGIAPRAMAAALWALYLSFHSVGRDFLSFQWDTLLLETGLLAILFAPPGLASTRRDPAPTLAAVLLMRWLDARLHLESGLAKVLGGDETWREMTACSYYYETAPLPTRPGWYAHHLPPRIQKFSTASAVAIEVAGPLLALGPRWARLSAFALFTGLQAAIALTGNYGFFNLLSAVIGLWLLDDDALARARLRLAQREPDRPRIWRSALETAAALPIFALTLRMLARFRGYPAPVPSFLQPVQKIARRLVAWIPRFRLPELVAKALAQLEEKAHPLRAVSPYGLFSAMTLERPEITVEGSDDGDTWREYKFRYKVDDLNEPPKMVAPHMPRLDWMMWFAALRSPPHWFIRFVTRLLEGSVEVLKLLRENPFPARPPRYIRAVIYRYNMTDLETRRETGQWWKRERLGLYLPPVTLRGAVV